MKKLVLSLFLGLPVTHKPPTRFLSGLGLCGATPQNEAVRRAMTGTLSPCLAARPFHPQPDQRRGQNPARPTGIPAIIPRCRR